MVTYKIVRFYLNGGKRTLRRGLTLAQAQAHCRNPETSSRTAKRARSRRAGPWFDGYTGE
jgi:hypothetical protein